MSNADDAEDTDSVSQRKEEGEDTDPGLIDSAMASIEDGGVQLGEHELPDSAAQLGSLGGKIRPHEWEDGVVLKQLSEYKYESVESMIREYITNGVATTLEAREHLGDAYSPLIQIGYHPSENLLIIEDNGMGMGDAEVEVGRKGGHTTRADNGKRPGRFGIGLYSGYTATGLDGAFFMESRSRKTGEHLKGVWVGEGFREDEDGQFPITFDENRYGTRFEFPLKPAHSDLDIHSFVRNKAAHCRIPVRYIEYESNGTERFNEEYGGTFFTAEADPRYAVIYEDEYVRAVVGRYRTDCIDEETSNSTQTVQLDSPIERNYSNTLTSFLPTVTYVYLKTENATVVAGPHEGLVRVSDSEYKDMSEERQEQYVPAGACTEEDIWMPTPAGDRDRLKKNDRYWEYLTELVEEEGEARLNRCLRTAVNGDPFALPDEDLHFTSYYIDDYLSRRNVSPETEIRRRTLTALDENELKNLEWFFGGTVEICEPGIDPRYRENRTRVHAWRAVDALGPEGTGFAAVRPTEKKARIVWEDHEDNAVVRIKKSYQYDFLENFGFRKLKDITSENVHEFDVPEEMQRWFDGDTPSWENPNVGRDGHEREVAVHNVFRERVKKKSGYRTGYEWKHSTASVIAEDLIEHLRWTNHPDTSSRRSYTDPARYQHYESVDHTDSITDIDTEYDEIPLFPTIRRVVVFHNTSDRNISDYYESVAVGRTAVVKCTKKASDYLTQSPHIITVDEALEEADRTLRTVDGEQSFRTICEDYSQVLLHFLSDETVDIFRTPSICERAGATMIHQRFGDERQTTCSEREETTDEAVYLPITEDDLTAIGILLGEYANETDFTLVTNGGMIPRHPQADSNKAFKSDTSLYAYASLREWEASSLHDFVVQVERSLENGGRQLVDCLAARHNVGLPPHGTEADALPCGEGRDGQ